MGDKNFESCSCSISNSSTYDFDTHECKLCDGYTEYGGCPEDVVGARRLSPATRMNVDQLLEMLQAFEMQGLMFPGMIYQGRAIDFDYFLGGTSFRFFVPILDGLAALAAPFFHHLLLFPLSLNGTVLGPVGKASEMVQAIQSNGLHSYLLVHFQRDGVKGKFVTSDSVLPKEDLHSYTFVGSVDPSWITPTLKAVGNSPFSTLQWNCQHFAVHVFEDLARACAASGSFNCPPEDVRLAFPLTISPAWCLPCQTLGVAGLSIGLVVMMVGLSYKLLKRSQNMLVDQQSERSKAQNKVDAELFE